jgi:hypothetical protein
MSVPTQLADRFLVGVDVEKYSGKNVRQQDETQRALDQILSKAALGAGLDRQLWATAPGGDGELAILPVDVDMVSVVGRFVSELDDSLHALNEDRVPAAKIRLRVAMHIDTVMHSAFGWAGPGPIVLSRLLDSAPLRAALASAHDASLVLLVSGPVYHKVVEAGLGGLRPRRFAAITIDNKDKGFHHDAWLYIPGVSRDSDARARHTAGPATDGIPRSDSQAAATTRATQTAESIINAEVISPVIYGNLTIGGVSPGPEH